MLLMYLIGSSKTEESRLSSVSLEFENGGFSLGNCFAVGLDGGLADDTESPAADRPLESLVGND